MMVLTAYFVGLIVGLMVGLYFGLIFGGIFKRKEIEEKQSQTRVVVEG